MVAAIVAVVELVVLAAVVVLVFDHGGALHLRIIELLSIPASVKTLSYISRNQPGPPTLTVHKIQGLVMVTLQRTSHVARL